VKKMRYLRWIVILLVFIFILLQIIYNIHNLTAQLEFVIKVPGKELFRDSVQTWLGLFIMFALGFGIAILFEIYYWLKYNRIIRTQNKIIQKLRKELNAFKPTGEEAKPQDQEK